ncbi:hypothetical protein [Microbacterium sp.]|uniref:hypothetical protein n=1 Tax=Microbacterium sp. TaxID=51671 RepID=UPI0028121316|nr:hypothetical protein [Microbacterium sp.]
MSTDDQVIEPGSGVDLAIERALEAANLRAGDAPAAAAVIVEVRHPSAAEAGDFDAAADGD